MPSKPTARSKVPTPDTGARDKIVAAARKHFLTHGFRSVTMDDLAAELGMSKKTFYAHFDSKVALVEAVLQAKLANAESDLEALMVASRDLSFPVALHDLLDCIHKHTGEIHPAFVRDIRRDAPEVFAVVETRRAAMIEKSFTHLLHAGRKAGRVRQDVPVRLIIEMLLATTQAIMNPQKIEQLKMTPKTGYAAIIDVILHGVMTDEGRTPP